MSKRISHSLLDPWMIPYVPRLYRFLRIPNSFPPEGIVLFGHLMAIAGATGMAFSVKYWWGGILGAGGVVGNHISDMVDGTHARHTGQCRNSGELLDHFVDPLSFSYWVIGIALSCHQLGLGIVAVISIYATAVLIGIKAKMMGEFTLARFGATEFKALLAVYGLLMTIVQASSTWVKPEIWATGFLWVFAIIGIIQLILNLSKAAREVNVRGSKPDTSNWQLHDSSDEHSQKPE